jgi:ABC-type glycerol-3-phosphate transport system permease component
MAAVSMMTADRAQAATVGGNLGTLLQWPWNWEWGNYAEALRQIGSEPWRGFADALANSIVVTSLVVVATVLSSSLVGFAIARMRFRGRNGLFLLMLATMMLPGQVTMIPMFLLFRNLGWVDTILPLVVPAFFGNAFFIFMYRQFIAQVPEALVEAAKVDGWGWLGIWWHVMLPLCRPVTAICAVFTFIYVWNDFMGPLIYLHSDEQATLAVALNSFRNQYGGVNKVNLLMAASLVTMLPCIVLFLAAQKQFIEGLGKGAVKG